MLTAVLTAAFAISPTTADLPVVADFENFDVTPDGVVFAFNDTSIASSTVAVSARCPNGGTFAVYVEGMFGASSGATTGDLAMSCDIAGATWCVDLDEPVEAVGFDLANSFSVADNPITVSFLDASGATIDTDVFALDGVDFVSYDYAADPGEAPIASVCVTDASGTQAPSLDTFRAGDVVAGDTLGLRTSNALVAARADFLALHGSDARRVPSDADAEALLRQVTDRLEAGGCVTDADEVQVVSGAYGSTLVGSDEGGALTATSIDRATRSFGATLSDGTTVLAASSAYSRNRRAYADRDDGGFYAGYFLPSRGTRGTFVGVTGSCDPGVDAAGLLSGWYGSAL
jgi:hypothetical protein